MARARTPTNYGTFATLLILHLLFQPFVLAFALPSPPGADDRGAGTGAGGESEAKECDPSAPGFISTTLCNYETVPGSNDTMPTPSHVDMPAPNTYDAQHPYFVWQEANFNDSKVLEYYTEWSRNAHTRRKHAVNGTIFEETRLFVHEHLGWEDFVCGADKQNCGCPMDSNVLNEIIAVVPGDAFRARQIYFIMKMLNWANKLVCTVLNAGTEAEEAMLGKAPQFAEIFFQHPDAKIDAHCDKVNAVVGGLIGAAITAFVILAIEFAGPLSLSALGTLGLELGTTAAGAEPAAEAAVPAVEAGTAAGAAGAGAAAKVATVEAGKAAAPKTVSEVAKAWDAATRPATKIFPAAWQMNTVKQNMKDMMQRTMTRLKQNAKKSKPEWEPKEIFTGNVEKFFFSWANFALQNEFKNYQEKNGLCGLPKIKDETLPNTAVAMIDISTQMKEMTWMLAARMAEINEGIPPPEGDPVDLPSEMSHHLRNLFGDFIPEPRILKVIESTSEIANTIEQFITERLVEKAWKTFPCYVHCGPNPGGSEGFCSVEEMGSISDIAFCPDRNTACQAACWRGGLDMTNVPLPGYNDPRIHNSVWNINLTDVVTGSYWEWYNNKTTYLGDYPKRALMTSVDELAAHRGPRLPVCVSNYATLREYTQENKGKHHNKNGHEFPCSCGNDYGADTQLFYHTDPKWYSLEAASGYHHLGDYVEMCRSRLQSRMQHEIGKFAVNMCYVGMRTYPPVRDPVMEGVREPERTKEGRQDCMKVIETVSGMRKQGKSDAEIDRAVCALKLSRGKTHEKGKHEGFQRILHEIRDKCE